MPKMSDSFESFLICPVRNATPEQIEAIERHIAALEADGEKLYWPYKHTVQTGDPVGVRICTDNRRAMFHADIVRLWFDAGSKGSCFDMGMAAFLIDALDRPFLSVVNPEELENAPHSPQRTIALALAGHLTDNFYGGWKLAPRYSAHEEYFSKLETMLFWEGRACVAFHAFSKDDPWDLFRLGLAFAGMVETPHRIIAPNDLPPTEDKSFNNFLLALAERTKDGPRMV